MDIKILSPDLILSTTHYVMKKVSKTFYRDGIPLENGAVITERRINRNRSLYERYCNLWSVYPDLYISLITPTTSKFRLKFF